jgi:hypothetical protein
MKVGGLVILAILVGSVRPALADETIPEFTMSGPSATPQRFGPYSNAAGTNKVFRITGSASIFNLPGELRVRFCWSPLANATVPALCSQTIELGVTAPVVVNGIPVLQPFDSGPWLLPGPCPLTVWVDFFLEGGTLAGSATVTNTTYSHVCGGSTVGAITMATQSPAVPAAGGPVALVALLFALAIVGIILARKSRSLRPPKSVS